MMEHPSVVAKIFLSLLLNVKGKKSLRISENHLVSPKGLYVCYLCSLLNKRSLFTNITLLIFVESTSYTWEKR